MGFSAAFLTASEAARQLGISVKALRLYEEHGLVTPIRSTIGWRAYGPDEMRRAQEIADLRALGFSLGQAAGLLQGDRAGLEQALSAHRATLETQLKALAATLARVRSLRLGLAQDRQSPTMTAPRAIAFDLPWPWNGERFELDELRPLTYITGPLGSGKTRLARCLTAAIPDAAYLDPERRPSVLAALEAEEPSAFVIDMPEQGLEAAEQRALMAQLRRRGDGARPLFLLTRSTAILDLDLVDAGEAILFCPANHGVPFQILPYPGAPGYEALASCLASPSVRARTAGVIAWRPEAQASAER